MEICTLCLILFIVATELWRLYLVWRKWKSFSEYPPEVLKPFIKDEDYKRLKVNTFLQCASMAAGIFLKLTIKVLKLSLGYEEFVWDVTTKYAETDVSRAAWYVVLDVFMTLCIEKPFELLGLLVITPGERHKIMDHLGSVLVEIGTASLLAGVLARSALFIVNRFGAMNLLLPLLIFEFFGLLIMVISTAIVVPLISRPLSTTSESEMKVRELAKAVGFPENKILVDVTEGRPASTFYLGVFGSNILVINIEMIHKLSPQQTVAQVAHELGHWKYRHSLLRLMFTLAEVMMISILSIRVYCSPSFDKLFGFAHEDKPHPLVRSYLAIEFIWPVLREWFKGPSNVLMSQCEYQADKWACSKGHAEHLKSGLLVREGHLSTPEFDNWFKVWFYAMPTVSERVKRIGTYPTSEEQRIVVHGDSRR